jgi:glycosyltransferase involved in cell wall biosynthesis
METISLANITQNGVSVVICCFNSSSRIVTTLEHLLKQINITFPWEVVIIDNNSSDGTAKIAIDTWTGNNGACPIRIVREPNPGTMRARRKGIEESKYRYLLFCDDDNWLHSNYVKEAYDYIRSDSRIAAVGGMGLLKFEHGFIPPPWLERFKRNFGAGPQGSKDGDTTNGKGCLYTAGCILDRQWLDLLYSMGFKSSLPGRHAKSLVAGEDTELTYALKLLGGQLHFSSKLWFNHYMPKTRLTWSYLKRMWESFGYSDFLLSPYKIHFRTHEQSLIKLILKQFIVMIWFWLLAWTTFFAEGDENVLKFRRYWGQLNASLCNSSIFFENKKMIENLVQKRAQSKMS